MLLLPHSTHVHLSHVSACSAGARSTNFDMLPLTAQGARATVMTGGQCCRHVGAATAACTAHVPDLRTTLWTSVLGCGVLLRSLSNQTPCSTCPGPLPPPTCAPCGCTACPCSGARPCAPRPWHHRRPCRPCCRPCRHRRPCPTFSWRRSSRRACRRVCASRPS